MLYDELIAAGFVSELENAFQDSERAKRLIRKAGLPLARLPAIGSMPWSFFWDEVCNQANLGIVKNGLENLVEAASKENPGSAVFERCLTFLRGTRAGACRNLRILFLSANAMNTERIRQDQEYRTISELARQRECVTVTPVLAVRPSDLLQAIRDHSPHLLHFAGHGSLKGAIFLENDRGIAKAVPAEFLGGMLRTVNRATPDPIQCVVLNACYTAKAAETLVSAVDVVVGSSEAILDKTALAFAHGFYTGVFTGANTQSAFEMGQAQVGPQKRLGADQLRLVSRDGFEPATLVLCAKAARKS